MRAWLATLHPRRIGGQILLLVAISAILTQTLNFAVSLANDANRHDDNQFRAGIITFIGAARMAGANGPADWARLAALVRNTDPGIQFSVKRAAKTPPSGAGPALRARFLMRMLGPGYRVNEAPESDDASDNTRKVFVQTPNGALVSARLTLPGPPPRPPIPAWSLFIFAVVFLPLVFVWAAWNLSRQINGFARAAEDFSLGGDHELLPETGPYEIQQAARALNRMRDRIAGLIEDRTRMLSAVSHDLRTPITRLRLRAEFVEDEHIRRDIFKDLDRMNRMVNSALTYIRDGRDSEKAIPLDLPPLVRTVGDSFIDLGEDVTYEGEEHLNVIARPDALVRAVENLVENGLKFGTRVVVRTGWDTARKVFIEVEDNGTGIAPAQRDAMLEPFARGDSARNDGISGFGLGLSITASIARAHGGQLVLSSGAMGGLLARMVLPGGKPGAPGG